MSQEFCIYLGPTIRGVIQNGTVLRGDKTAAVQSISSAVAKYPMIADLVVSGDTVAADITKVKTKGNLLNVRYRQLVAQM